MTPDRERDLATHVALSVAADVGLDYTDAIDRNTTLIRLNELTRMGDPRLTGFWQLGRHERYDLCDRIAALARTATITVTIPTDTEETTESE